MEEFSLGYLTIVFRLATNSLRESIITFPHAVTARFFAYHAMLLKQKLNCFGIGEVGIHEAVLMYTRVLLARMRT